MQDGRGGRRGLALSGGSAEAVAARTPPPFDCAQGRLCRRVAGATRYSGFGRGNVTLQNSATDTTTNPNDHSDFHSRGCVRIVCRGTFGIAYRTWGRGGAGAAAYHLLSCGYSLCDRGVAGFGDRDVIGRGGGLCEGRDFEYSHWDVSGDRDHCGCAVGGFSCYLDAGARDSYYFWGGAALLGLSFAAAADGGATESSARSARYAVAFEWWLP